MAKVLEKLRTLPRTPETPSLSPAGNQNDAKPTASFITANETIEAKVGEKGELSLTVIAPAQPKYDGYVVKLLIDEGDQSIKRENIYLASDTLKLSGSIPRNKVFRLAIH